VPSEIQPLNTRSAGQSITTFVQLTSGATVGQTFLSMLCSMKYGEQKAVLSMTMKHLLSCIIMLSVLWLHMHPC